MTEASSKLSFSPMVIVPLPLFVTNMLYPYLNWLLVTTSPFTVNIASINFPVLPEIVVSREKNTYFAPSARLIVIVLLKPTSYGPPALFVVRRKSPPDKSSN